MNFILKTLDGQVKRITNVYEIPDTPEPAPAPEPVPEPAPGAAPEPAQEAAQEPAPAEVIQ